jgi:hypothetical protein
MPRLYLLAAERLVPDRRHRLARLPVLTAFDHRTLTA